MMSIEAFGALMDEFLAGHPWVQRKFGLIFQNPVLVNYHQSEVFIMRIRALFRRYPLGSYFLLAYGISWGGSLLMGGPKYLRGETLTFDDGGRMALFMFAGPFVAGILSTGLVDGRSGLADLWARMRKWRVGARWYASALLTFPAMILTILLLLTALTGAEFTPSLIAFGVVAGLAAGFFEEVGWTGYAYPRMRLRFGTLRGALVLGLLHGLWHAPAGYLGEAQAFGVYWLPRFVVMWMVAMVAMRVILVWIYTNTGSVLLAQLTHASSTGSLIIFGPSPISPANETLWWAIYAVALWLVAGFLMVRYGDDLIRKTEASKVGQASI